MKTVFLTVLVAIVAGCASVGPNDYSRSEARVVQTVAYGTVESVRAARLTEDKPIVGTLAGAALGGLLGNSIGHGGGRAAATVIGAVGGGIAGNAIERHATAQDVQEIVIRLDNGTTIAVVQGATQGLETGQRVRVLTGPKGSRVEPA
ncbi:MAG TPA: glycine zipper 2TM domain-containing protein [Burkholderiales bacterium]|nr:glycine zipper 2TM domain-containing protein [Burkholderiales bacterium]